MSWIDVCRPLTKTSESCRLTAYWDAHGKVWTIGWGATGPGIAEGVVWTQEHADSDLDARLMRIGAYVDSVVTVPLNDNQKAALVDFAYNVGEGNLHGSTLLRLLNAGDYAGAANEFLRWNRAGGVVLNGLITRRRVEQHIFTSPVGESKPEATAATQPVQSQPNPIAMLIQFLLNLFRRGT